MQDCRSTDLPDVLCVFSLKTDLKCNTMTTFNWKELGPSDKNRRSEATKPWAQVPRTPGGSPGGQGASKAPRERRTERGAGGGNKYTSRPAQPGSH